MEPSPMEQRFSKDVLVKIVYVSQALFHAGIHFAETTIEANKIPGLLMWIQPTDSVYYEVTNKTGTMFRGQINVANIKNVVLF